MATNVGGGHRVGAIKARSSRAWRPKIVDTLAGVTQQSFIDRVERRANINHTGDIKMTGRRWAASGRKPARQTERPYGSWDAAVDRARREWDALTGGPDVGSAYSDAAAAAILRTALGLWPDTAARMAGEGEVERGPA